MSYIKLTMSTETQTDEIEIHFKGECSPQELEIATGFLMGKLATSSDKGYEVLCLLMADIERAMVENND